MAPMRQNRTEFTDGQKLAIWERAVVAKGEKSEDSPHSHAPEIHRRG